MPRAWFSFPVALVVFHSRTAYSRIANGKFRYQENGICAKTIWPNYYHGQCFVVFFFFVLLVLVLLVGWLSDMRPHTNARARHRKEKLGSDASCLVPSLGEHRGTKIMTGKWFSMQIAPLDVVAPEPSEREIHMRVKQLERMGKRHRTKSTADKKWEFSNSFW